MRRFNPFRRFYMIGPRYRMEVNVDLSKLVEIYRRKNAPRHKNELDHFRGFPTLRDTVEAATMAVGPDGKMLRHQRRVGKDVLAQAKDVLLQRLTEIEKCCNFAQLIDLVKQSTEAIDRFGSLAVYDTALRIGAKLNRLPEVVYLHAGTRTGAKALDLDTSQPFLRIAELPEPLRQLEPHEIEDFLCIYKEHFDSAEEDTEAEAAQGCGQEAMADNEMVLQLGVEGGGATVFRTPFGSGGWQFHVEGSSMFLDENDDEDWRSWQSQRFPNIEDAVRSISADGEWVVFYPISVHPDYRSAVWELVQQTVRNLPNEKKHFWEDRRRERWQHQCQQES